MTGLPLMAHGDIQAVTQGTLIIQAVTLHGATTAAR